MVVLMVMIKMPKSIFCKSGKQKNTKIWSKPEEAEDDEEEEEDVMMMRRKIKMMKMPKSIDARRRETTGVDFWHFISNIQTPAWVKLLSGPDLIEPLLLEHNSTSWTMDGLERIVTDPALVA
jgi:hypothetical protein